MCWSRCCYIAGVREKMKAAEQKGKPAAKRISQTLNAGNLIQEKPLTPKLSSPSAKMNK
jgi:hypothetical protein